VHSRMDFMPSRLPNLRRRSASNQVMCFAECRDHQALWSDKRREQDGTCLARAVLALRSPTSVAALRDILMALLDAPKVPACGSGPLVHSGDR
jgi:hypothetical protein